MLCRERKSHVPETFWNIVMKHRQDGKSTEFFWVRGRLFDHHIATVLYQMCLEASLATITKVRFPLLILLSTISTTYSSHGLSALSQHTAYCSIHICSVTNWYFHRHTQAEHCIWCLYQAKTERSEVLGLITNSGEWKHDYKASTGAPVHAGAPEEVHQHP